MNFLPDPINAARLSGREVAAGLGTPYGPPLRMIRSAWGGHARNPQGVDLLCCE
jgi:hypothetical protein